MILFVHGFYSILPDVLPYTCNEKGKKNEIKKRERALCRCECAPPVAIISLFKYSRLQFQNALQLGICTVCSVLILLLCCFVSLYEFYYWFISQLILSFCPSSTAAFVGVCVCLFACILCEFFFLFFNSLLVHFVTCFEQKWNHGKAAVAVEFTLRFILFCWPTGQCQKIFISRDFFDCSNCHFSLRLSP